MLNIYITVSLKERTLYLITSQGINSIFPVAVGAQKTPTPIGTWRIQNKKILNENSAFGTHWLGLNIPGYGLHGTNRPELIGQAVSAGCIRMYNRDILYVFQKVRIGTIVIITE